jgi:hypothetical protein
MIFILLVTNTIACSVYNEDVQSFEINKKYYFHLDGVNIFKISFKKDNTFSMRIVPVRSSIFNCRRYSKISGIYSLCKDNIKLFWFVKRAKDMILYEVEAIIFRKDMIKAVSLKEKKCN